jgi:hypothetical protein
VGVVFVVTLRLVLVILFARRRRYLSIAARSLAATRSGSFGSKAGSHPGLL